MIFEKWDRRACRITADDQMRDAAQFEIFDDRIKTGNEFGTSHFAIRRNTGIGEIRNRYAELIFYQLVNTNAAYAPIDYAESIHFTDKKV